MNMLMKTRIASLAATAALSFSSVSAAEGLRESEARIALAKQYLTAYSTFDVAKMEPFLSEEMVFEDPTTTSSQNSDGEHLVYDGKEAVLKGLGGHSAQFASFSIHYQIERQYESNGVVVFVAQLSYTGEAKSGEKFTGGAPIVTAVTVKDGKITRHTDYFDYKENAKEFSE
jgi:ketosteroid isomerase-like protein